MTASNYDHCEDLVLVSEGGYTNDRRDPGGPTNWGITIYDARLYWKHNAQAEDVRNMPKAVAQMIYRKKYWNALDCDDLPSGLDYTVFDYGVNSGIARSGRVLRRCIGFAVNDWHVTSEVIAAVNKRDIKLLIGEINTERLKFLEGLSTWSHFGRGWAARVRSVRTASLQLQDVGKTTPSVEIAYQVGKGVDGASEMFAHLAGAWDAVNHRGLEVA